MPNVDDAENDHLKDGGGAESGHSIEQQEGQSQTTPTDESITEEVPTKLVNVAFRAIHK